VPYALSLRPSANIEYSSVYTVLYVGNNGTASTSNGLYAYANGNGAAAVYGEATDHQAYGVEGINNYGGVAVYSRGAFLSTTDSRLELSPHALIARSSPGLTLTPTDKGAMNIDAAGAGDYYVSLPLSTFGTLFGSQLYVKSLDVCYHVNAGGKIVATFVIKGDGAGGWVAYLSEVFPRASTSRTLYGITADIPRKPIDYASWLQFNLSYTYAGTVTIEAVELTLSEKQN